MFNVLYGSAFSLVVPENSEVQTAADLDGKTIGVSGLAGGEVPVIRGILRSVGMTEQDVELLLLGTAYGDLRMLLTGPYRSSEYKPFDTLRGHRR